MAKRFNMQRRTLRDYLLLETHSKNLGRNGIVSEEEPKRVKRIK
jgi:hypothetical protein